MEFFETVYNRKTIRKYKEEKPPIDDIKKIIDSARVAPSATNSQNWKFLVIYNDEIKRQMADAVNCVYDEFNEIIEDDETRRNLMRYKPFSTFFQNAPVVIACVETERTSAVTEYLKNSGMPYEEVLLYKPDSSLLSMGGAIENMSLSATALGYGTCWLCAPIIAYKRFKNILKLEKTDKIVSLLTIGRPENNNANQPDKKSLDEIIEIID